MRDSGDEEAEQRTVPSKEYREYSALCTLMYSADVSAPRRSQFDSERGGEESARRDSMDASEHSTAAGAENAQAQAVANGGGNGVDVAEGDHERSGGSSSILPSAPSSASTSDCPTLSSARADAMDVE